MGKYTWLFTFKTEGEISYMYDEAIRYYNITLSISELVRQIEMKDIILDGKGYRYFVWSINKQSLFIDSIFRDFPSPPIYLFKEEEDDSLIIIDGIQRLTTIYLFFKNELKINSINSNLNGKYFNEFDKVDQRKFLRGRVEITIVEDTWNSKELIAELFYRLNISGENLTNQEYRNRLYFGGMIDCIETLNNNKLWRKIYKNGISKRYRDSEYILKFFTVINVNYNNLNSISKSMDEFIGYNRNDNALAEECKLIFTRSIEKIYKYIGEEAVSINNKFSPVLFDSLLIPLGILIKDNIECDIEYAYNKLINMIKDRELASKSLRYRIDVGLSLLRGDIYEL